MGFTMSEAQPIVVALFAPIYCPISGLRRYCYVGDRKAVEKRVTHHGRVELYTYEEFRKERDFVGEPWTLEIEPYGLTAIGEDVCLGTTKCAFEVFQERYGM